MIKDNQRLEIYLGFIVNSVFKILPLYEENNVGIKVHVGSLIFELNGMSRRVNVDIIAEYESIMNILSSIEKEVGSESSSHAVIKRETFKCIDIIKNIIKKLEDGEYHDGLYR